MNPVATALPHSMLPQPAVMETKPMKKCLWQRQVLNKSTITSNMEDLWKATLQLQIGVWSSQLATAEDLLMNQAPVADDIYVISLTKIHSPSFSTLSPRLRGYRCTTPPRRTSWWWDRPKWKLWCHLWQPTAWCSWPPELPWHQWRSRAFLGWSPGWSHTSRTTGQRFPAWAETETESAVELKLFPL